MREAFSDIWNKQPNICESGLCFFGGENDGDFFCEEDAINWQGCQFEQNYYTDKLLNNVASRKLIDEIVDKKEPYIDFACGPGMGLIPSIKKISSEIPCLATDANPILIKEWRKWLSDKNIQSRIELAQFSLFDIPIEDCSVKSCGGFLSISSTRSGNNGYNEALSEIYRTLAPGGRLYVIESEWLDLPSILKVFEESGIQPWNCFLEEQMTWHERFIDHDFAILSEERYLNRRLNREDNELGGLAEMLGVQIEMQWTAFILEK